MTMTKVMIVLSGIGRGVHGNGQLVNGILAQFGQTVVPDVCPFKNGAGSAVGNAVGQGQVLR